MKSNPQLKLFLLLFLLSFQMNTGNAQTKSPVTITGSMGVSYEHYGLSKNPSASSFYTARRPWNQVRFSFNPNFQFGKNFSLPFNMNFATKPTNFAGPFSGLGTIGKQNFKQWIMNPANNFAINPKYKWAELQLGTQYLNYSELSTGDIGVFGAGFDVKPKTFLIKFFTGTSQQAINQTFVAPTTPGAYKRTNWMAQLGKEQEGKYKVAFNMAKGRDFFSSVTTPPTPTPQDGMIFTFLTDIYFKKGVFFKTELGKSLYTQNTRLPYPGSGTVKGFEPFIKSNGSTQSDYAATLAFGKKISKWELGFKGRYLGAGYLSMGYPYQQSDKLDLTVNTKFNAWKDKMNVVASVGNRTNDISNALTRANQFIGNLNWFTQFNEHWSLNVNYNNFGFNTPGSNSLINPFPSIKNVSNDVGFNPTYTWSTKKMSNILTFSYNYSKYKETYIPYPLLTPVTTNNNTHTALLNYIPTFFNKKISPDFSFLYFLNQIPGFKSQLISLSAGLAVPLAKEKINLRGQLQYMLSKNGIFTNNNNAIGSITVDYKIHPKINWNTSISSNYFKYGNELSSVAPLLGANYLETTIRTGILYRWK